MTFMIVYDEEPCPKPPFAMAPILELGYICCALHRPQLSAPPIVITDR